MSKALDLIEEAADTQSFITDPDIIRDVMDQFLNMTFLEFVGGKEGFTFITDDIVRGFDLDEEKLRDIKIADLLILIGYEPGIEYFAIPEEEHWFHDHNPDPKFYSAAHCMYLGSLIADRRKKHPVLESLWRIDFEAFIKYLRDVAAHSDYSFKHKREMDWDLSAMNACVFNFVEEHCKRADDKDLIAVSLGTVMNNLFNVGSRPWRCECLHLGNFIWRTVNAYKLMRNIFMTGIRMNLVNSGRSDLWRLVKLYGKSETKDNELIESIKFEYCYE